MNIKLLTNYLSLFLIMFLMNFAEAKYMFQQGQPTRYLGMGGTGVAFVRGVDSLMLNPAALTKVEGISFSFANVNMGISTNMIEDFSDMNSSGSSFTASDVNNLYGHTYFIDSTAFGGFVIPYFGFAVYANNTIYQAFNNPAYSTYSVDLTSDYGYVVGGGFQIGSYLSFGVAGRHVKRWQGIQDLDVGLLLGSNPQDVLKANLKNKGYANAVDLGLLLSFPNSNSHLGLTWKDVGATKFTKTSGDGPNQQPENMILGYAHQTELGFITWTNAADYKFIRNNGDISKKLHFGTELSLALIDLRAGFYQGYMSYGAGLDLSFFKLDVTSYAGELGASAGQTQNDRYQIGLSLNLDMDQTFKVKNSDGKRRKLSQRR